MPALRRAHQRGHLAQHLEDLGQAALVEHQHRHAGTDQIGGNVGLDVRKAQHQVGPQGHDLLDARAGEGADLGLFLPRAARRAP
jgi:hypothetical protein